MQEHFYRFPQKSALCDPRICGKTSQIGVDEAVERTVHDGVDVGCFEACPRVLDERIGHENVVADLAAPFDLELCALDIGDLVQMLTLLDLDELRAQHPHTRLAVLELIALRLAGDDDAGRLVNETHGGACLVDVLAARAGGAVDLHFDILRPDIDLGLLHFRGLSRHFRRGLFLRGRGMLVFFCHDTNNLLNKNLGHAARLAHIGTQRKRCLHTKTPPMSY